MEGLIPYLLHAIKKQRPQHKFRSFSGTGSNSNRSYHLLTTSGNDSLEGSSHCRTRSEFPAPATADLFEQRSELHFAYSRSYKEESGASAAAASLPGGSKKDFYPYQAASRKSGFKGGASS